MIDAIVFTIAVLLVITNIVLITLLVNDIVMERRRDAWLDDSHVEQQSIWCEPGEKPYWAADDLPY